MVTKQQIIQELKEKRFSESILCKLIKNPDYWKNFSENNQAEQLNAYEKKEIINALFDYICINRYEENWSIDNEGFVIFNQQKQIFHKDDLKNDLVPEKRKLLKKSLNNYYRNIQTAQRIIRELREKKLVESDFNNMLKESDIGQYGLKQIRQSY